MASFRYESLKGYYGNDMVKDPKYTITEGNCVRILKGRVKIRYEFLTDQRPSSKKNTV